MTSQFVFYALNGLLLASIPNFSIFLMSFFVFLVLCSMLLLYKNQFQHAFTVNSQAFSWTYLKLFFPIYLYAQTARLYDDVIILKALTIAVVFFIIFFIGLNNNTGRKAAKILPMLCFSSDRTSTKQKIGICLLLYIISIVGIIKSREAGITHFIDPELARSNVNYIFSFLIDFKVYITILLVFWCFKFSKYKYLFLLILCEMILALLDGGRSAFLKPFLTLMFVGTYCGNYLRTSIYTYMNLFLSALLILVPFLTIYKKSVLELLLRAEVFVIDVHLAFDAIRNMDLSLSNILYNVYDTSVHFSGMFDGIQRVALKVPDIIDYRTGETFLSSWVTGLVPRALWPEKPIFLPGRYFSVEIFDHNSRIEDPGVSQGIGLISELFLNFGFLGVAFAFLLGVYVKFFLSRTRLYGAREHVETSLVRWYFLIMKVSIVLQLNLSTFWIGTLRQAIFCYVFMCLLTLSFPKIVKK